MLKNKKLPTKSSKIVYIGDSHSVMSMGRNLLEVWEQTSPDSFQQLCFYAVAGSTFQDWKTGNLEHLKIKNLKKESFSQALSEPEVLETSLIELLQKEKPQLLILALGTNDILKFQTHFDSYLQELLSELKNLHQSFGVSLLWVMPPVLPQNLDPHQTRSKLLTALKSLPFLQIIDIDFIFPDQEDGYHFHKKQAQKFSQSLINEFLNKKIL